MGKGIIHPSLGTSSWEICARHLSTMLRAKKVGRYENSTFNFSDCAFAEVPKECLEQDPTGTFNKNMLTIFSVCDMFS
jgi:hypothetical protein